MKISIFLWTCFFGSVLQAQIVKSSTVKIDFLSESVLENIEAKNKSVTAVLNESKAELAFVVKIREFKFENSLQEEHFNENYMETDKFPVATFSGKIIDYQQLEEGEERQIFVEGKLTIHGVTKNVRIPGKIKKVNKTLLISSVFKVKTEDYKIKIPSLLWQNIAEEIILKIEGELK